MNHTSRVIVVLAAVVISIAFALAASQPASPVIYLDDVYYWPDDDPQPAEPAEGAANAVTVSTTPVAQQSPKVIFLDDSITRQNPDTVVRVRIKR